jgi:hypothetical protein
LPPAEAGGGGSSNPVTRKNWATEFDGLQCSDYFRGGKGRIPTRRKKPLIRVFEVSPQNFPAWFWNRHGCAEVVAARGHHHIFHGFYLRVKTVSNQAFAAMARNVFDAINIFL